MGFKRIQDYGVKIGNLKCGENNLITDVKGVKVGHTTLNNGDITTGVTTIIPHGGNIYKEKLIAASHVINGFGKTIGTIQIEELGTLETPIVLTNTLSVGTASDALIEYMLSFNEDIGISTGTVNPVVCECNDGYLNDIRGRHIKKEHIFDSINNSGSIFEEGAVGAGTGMTCYGLKGGIGSSSRIVELEGNDYTVGILVLSNFGIKENFILNGLRAGEKIWNQSSDRIEEEKGSIIIILATDIPLSYRQLKRVIKRSSVAIARTGSFSGNGSGEITIGFTTANRINHYEESDIVNIKILNENMIDKVFLAVADACEEAILNSIICSDTTTGRDGHIRKSLVEYLNKLDLE
ncbi:DmpA family aminopeptidase [Oceanirhabdus sp. W0125-5]|uniref:DmpA family aminopeptidase n=1 Tax=Oceanirhabdus sp. W0125-5 TaxID=2999116 RepID=UPI0022F2D2C5|nr:P1 family peptidase [Oceanirhabdus sp. W0125-5]WBW94892.1 P1 family peptidase [Oceanirhabdus sp. W0125-5]